MRIYLYITLFSLVSLLPQYAVAATLPKHIEYWVYAVPTVQVDITDTCTSASTARFDWVYATPAILIDTTATCTSAQSSTITPKALIQTKVELQGKLILE